MMAGKKRVCIVGGGAAGTSLLWCLAQDDQTRQEWDITLIHDQKQLGGHSWSLPFKHNGKLLPVDIGVQFISPMLYPNVHEMLKRSEFRSKVPMVNYEGLKIACGFPRQDGEPRNWGNFAAYQAGSNFALYSADMKDDAQTFESFLELALFEGWAKKTLQSYFDDPPQNYNNKDDFLHYLLFPYLSIINGYGAALMSETQFLDILPLFDKIPLVGFPTPLGSLTDPGVGWQRFKNGASSWVAAMAEVASSFVQPTILLNSKATAVWTDHDDNDLVHVQWTESDGVSMEGAFDKVVLTTDMWTCASLLNNANNDFYWKSIQEKYVAMSVWDLMYGYCVVHTDSSMLSPDLMEQQETLQFTAFYAPQDTYPYYDLTKTYTTYLQQNLLQSPDAAGLYLTMYGYVPQSDKGDKVPDPDSVLYDQQWTHGKWSPSFMGGAKTGLHMAQGKGAVHYEGQGNTNVYFAGNNTTTDSEEGALDAAMAMANYAFNVRYPMGDNLLAYGMYAIYYHEVMFPDQSPSHRLAFLRHLL